MRKKTIYLAVDAHDEPYYGKRQQWAVGGKRKQSTNSFTRIVALYMVHPDRPILLAVSTQKEKGTEDETAITMLRELLQFFSKEHWKIKRIVVLADGKVNTTVTTSYNSCNVRTLTMLLIGAYSSRRRLVQSKTLRTNRKYDPLKPLSFTLTFKPYIPQSLLLPSVL